MAESQNDAREMHDHEAAGHESGEQREEQSTEEPRAEVHGQGAMLAHAASQLGAGAVKRKLARRAKHKRATDAEFDKKFPNPVHSHAAPGEASPDPGANRFHANSQDASEFLPLKTPKQFAAHDASIKAGGPAWNALLDGSGKEMGLIYSQITAGEDPNKVTENAAKQIRINYGQRKSMFGQSYLFAFNVITSVGHASGWIAEGALEKSPHFDEPGRHGAMPTVNLPTAGVVTGKSSAIKAPDLKKGAYAHGYRDHDPHGDKRFVRLTQAQVDGLDKSEMKVLEYVGLKERAQAGDYYVRPDGGVYLCYSLPKEGGVATDVFPVGQKVIRCQAPPPARVNLYYPDSSQSAGEMTFVFCVIEDGQGNRREGWMAEDCLTAPEESPHPRPAVKSA